MNTKGIKVFEAIGRLPEDLVMEAQRYSVNYEENPEEKRSRRPAWLTGGVIAAAVCVLVGIVTYVGILTFMSGGFDRLAALFGKDDTTAETTLDETEDVTSRNDEETTSEESKEETTQIDDVEQTDIDLSEEIKKIKWPIGVNEILEWYSKHGTTLDYPPVEEIEVRRYTEEELNSISEFILHPENGKTLCVYFGLDYFYSYDNFSGDVRYKGTDSFLGWIATGEYGQFIPVTVEFEPGILNEESVLPSGIVVLSEKGVEFIDGRVIYHAKDIIFDAIVDPDRIEDGVIYGTMQHWSDEQQVKFVLPEDFDIAPNEMYSGIDLPEETTMSKETIMCPWGQGDLLELFSYYNYKIKDVSYKNLKYQPFDDGIWDLSEIVPGKLEYIERSYY